MILARLARTAGRAGQRVTAKIDNAEGAVSPIFACRHRRDGRQQRKRYAGLVRARHALASLPNSGGAIGLLHAVPHSRER